MALGEPNFLDILFENRNQEYGAYELRKSYFLTLRLAVLLGLAVAIVPLVGYFWIEQLTTEPPKLKNEVIVQLDKLPPPPEIEKPKPKVEAPKANEGGKAGGGTPAATLKPTIKFVPPTVKKDEEIKKEEPPPKVNEIKPEVAISNQTQKGDSLATATARGTGGGVNNGNGTGVGDGNGTGNGTGDGTGSGTPTAPPPPQPEERIAPRLVRITQPQYTEEARSKRLKARVEVLVQIDDTGKVTDARISRRWIIGRNNEETPTSKLEYGLEEAALSAASRHLFRPARLNGKPIPSEYTLDMKFGAE
jgi:protein TonB